MGFHFGLAVFVFASTLLASFTPGIIVRSCARSAQLAIDIVSSGSALSAGIILGALLCHLWPEAEESFEQWSKQREAEGLPANHFPLVGAICGTVCLILVAVDGLILHRLTATPEEGGHGHGHGHDHVTDGLRTLSRVAAEHQQQEQQQGDAEEAGDATPELELVVTTHARPGGSSEEETTTALSATAGSTDAATPAFTAGRAAASAGDESLSLLRRTHAADRLSPVELLVPGAIDVDEQQPDAVAGSPAATPLRSSSSEGSEESTKTGSSSAAAVHVAVTSVVVAGGADRHEGPLLPLTSPAQTAADTRKAVVRAWILFAAMSLHGVFDGLSIGNATSDMSGTAVAVASHKMFDGIALGSALYPAPLPPRQRAILLTLSALTTPLGMAVGAFAEAVSEGATDYLVNGVFLSAAAGSFIYITFMELLPSCVADGRRVGLKYSLAALGFGAMALLALRS